MRVVKLLLDENLSPSVAAQLSRLGEDVVGVRDLGLLGASDRDVFARALELDRIVATSDCDDFRELASSAELHGGLVLLEDGELGSAQQQDAIGRAIAAIREEYAVGREMIGRGLWVSASDLRFEDLPRRGDS